MLPAACLFAISLAGKERPNSGSVLLPTTNTFSVPGFTVAVTY